jgi:hypothetical protein
MTLWFATLPLRVLTVATMAAVLPGWIFVLACVGEPLGALRVEASLWVGAMGDGLSARELLPEAR